MMNQQLDMQAGYHVETRSLRDTFFRVVDVVPLGRSAIGRQQHKRGSPIFSRNRRPIS